MNLYVNVVLSFALCGHRFGVMVESDKLIAINSASSVRKLYKQIGNGDAPSPESDRAYADADLRKRICDDITHSGYFPKKGLHPFDKDPGILSLRLRNDKLFSRIYEILEPKGSSSLFSRSLASPIFEYRNLFTRQEFEIRDFNGTKISLVEHVIVCLLRDEREGQLWPYYVSKEYNVVGDPFRAGRFIFTERGPKTSPFFFTDMFLAEEPAKVFEEKENPRYNVELKYLERRQDLSLAPDDASDPVCKLLSDFPPDNEQDRLCAMVLNSSDFRGTAIQYPESWFLGKCAELKISFRTEEAIKVAGEKVYRERALRCYCRNIDKNNRYEHFYISRAYAPNEVFVLHHDYLSGQIFLKNLTVDVGIVRDGVV